MIRVFVSSTFRDLEKERTLLREKLKLVLIDIGMEDFIPDGKTSQEIGIDELGKSDIAIFLISPYYGSFIKECKVKDCKADCAMKKRYLFSWDEIPGNDSLRLIEFLTRKFCIDWAKMGQIEKTSDGKRIRVTNGENYISLRLNNEITKIEVEIDDFRKDEFLVNTENGKINVYNKREKISYTHCEYKIALAEKKPHQVYLIDKGWDIIRELRDWKEIDWRRVREKPAFKEINNDEIEHYFYVTKNVLQFREEVENEFCPRIKDIDDIETITSDLANNIVKWYLEEKIELQDFCGRRKELIDLFNKMNASVEVDGVGGIGKTTLIHVALLIQRLKGTKIATVGTRQSYITDSGYKGFRDKLKKNQHEIIGNKIALDDIIYALSFPEEIRAKQKDEIIRIISDKIEKENMFLFIDDFQLADDDVKELVKNTHRNMVLASKKNIGLARNELHLTGIDAKEIGKLIDLIASRLDKKINDEVKEKIKEISEGHPVFTEILVRNYELISFQKLKEYKHVFDLSNPEHVGDFLKRVVEEILSREAVILLKNLSVINTELETNLDVEAIKQIYPKDFNKIFRELIDTGFLEKRMGKEGIYQFSYKHIQEAIRIDEKEPHEKAIEYYKNKNENIQNYDNAVEILFHKSKSNPVKILIEEYLVLYQKLKPVHFGFKRLIDVGQELESYFDDDKDKASILGMLGNLYGNIGRFEEATTQNKVGNLCRDLNGFEHAEKAFKEALKILTELAEKSPDAYLPDVAMTQNNLGNLYSDSNRFEDAEKAFTEALKILTELAEKSPDAYLSDVAMTQNNLGNLYRNIGRFEDAEKAFKETLKIHTGLAEKNPDAYLSDVAMTQNNLGVLYRNIGQFEDAEKAFKEALKFCKELAENSPDAYLLDVATTQNNLGNLYSNLKMFEEAEKAFKEALKIHTELAEKSPDAYLLDVAMTQNNLGILYTDLNMFEDAEKAFTEALKIRKDLES